MLSREDETLARQGALALLNNSKLPSLATDEIRSRALQIATQTLSGGGGLPSIENYPVGELPTTTIETQPEVEPELSPSERFNAIKNAKDPISKILEIYMRQGHTPNTETATKIDPEVDSQWQRQLRNSKDPFALIAGRIK